MFRNENLQKINEIVERFRTLYSSYGFMLTSRDIAEYTGKRHADVLKDIEVVIRNITSQGRSLGERNFSFTHYIELLNLNEKIDKDEILKLIDKQIKELENLKNKIKNNGGN